MLPPQGLDPGSMAVGHSKAMAQYGEAGSGGMLWDAHTLTPDHAVP